MNKYSIILPVRNGGDYVKACVGSVLKQTLQDFNLIVLDNHSSDGTIEWLRELRDPRIILYYSDRPLSIEKNWGRIKDVPKNEYMTMIGHDDVLLPHYLEEYSELISKHPTASLYQSHYDYIDENTKLTRACLPMDEVQLAHEFLAFQLKDTINSTGTGYMMRSKDFESLNGMPVNYPNLIFADYELWMRLTRISYKATSLRKCFLYREHLSISRITNGMVYQTSFREYIEFMLFLQSTDPMCREVIERYGAAFLLSFCESLSHRLLKTPVAFRNITVRQLVRHFESYAERLIPGQDFQPLKISRIKYAIEFDKSSFHRMIFKLYKTIFTH